MGLTNGLASARAVGVGGGGVRGGGEGRRRGASVCAMIVYRGEPLTPPHSSPESLEHRYPASLIGKTYNHRATRYYYVKLCSRQKQTKIFLFCLSNQLSLLMDDLRRNSADKLFYILKIVQDYAITSVC